MCAQAQTHSDKLNKSKTVWRKNPQKYNNQVIKGCNVRQTHKSRANQMLPLDPRHLLVSCSPTNPRESQGKRGLETLSPTPSLSVLHGRQCHVLEHVPPKLWAEWGPCFSVSRGRQGHTLQLAASKLLAEWGPFVVFRTFIIHIITLVRSYLLKGNCEWAENSISLLSGG